MPGALFAYAASKASVLFAPLLLSAILPLSTYGMVEYSLSIGQILSVGLALGTPSSIPYLLLKRGKPLYEAIFGLHVIVVVIACILVFAICEVTGFTAVGMAALCAGISVIQSVESAKFRSAGNPIGSSLAEGVLYGLIMVFGIGAFLQVIPRSLTGLKWLFTIYLLGSLVWNVSRFPWKMSRLRMRRLYRISVNYGIRIVPASIANVGLVSSGRFFIGQIGSFELVAVYSLIYRMCAPIVAIHQFATNLIFPNLYTAIARKFESYFVLLTSLLITCGLFICLIGPHFAVYILHEKALLIAKRTDLFLMMSIVMVLWSQLSLMELFMERENRAYLQLPGFFFGCIITALCLVIPEWRFADQAITVALFQGIGLSVAIAWQFFKSGVQPPRWPRATLLVLAQTIVLVLSWLIIATKWSL